MQSTLWLRLITPVLGLGLATMVSATSTPELLGSFPEADNVRLVKHHNHLFAFTTSEDGLAVYSANRQATEWTELDSDTTSSITDLVTDTAEISTFGLFKGKVYTAAVNKDGVSQVWSMCNHCRPATWEQSGEAGFGDASNTEVVDLLQVNQALYAITSNAEGNGLFMTEDGENWTQIGEYGLGNSITDAVAASRVFVAGDAVNLGTANGVVYQADKSDLTTWSEITTLDGEITALRGRFVGVQTDSVASVYESDSSSVYTIVGELDLGIDHVDAVTRIVNLSRRPEVVVMNTTDGAAIMRYQPGSEAWQTIADEGLGNANNTNLTDLIHYRGHRYAATTNSADGPEVYRLNQN